MNPTEESLAARILEIANKWGNATEFFDPWIANDFVPLPAVAKNVLRKFSDELIKVVNESGYTKEEN